MKRVAIVLLLLGSSLAAAWWTLDRQLWVNGRRSSTAAIERDGQIYVPVSALRDAGAEVTVRRDRMSIQFTPVGGRDQLGAAEGRVGEWVSNGSWRVRVTDVARTTNPYTSRGQGYRLKLEMRNLTSAPLSTHGSGLNAVQLLDAEGKVLMPVASSFKDRYTSIPPSGGFTNTLLFGDPPGGASTIGKPSDVWVLFRNPGGIKLRNIRIHLDRER